MRFPGFDGEWEVKKLGDCSKSLDYGMNSAAIKFDGKNRYIRITDIDESSSGYKSDSPVSPDGELSDKYLVQENDILFARTGASTGKTYLYNVNDGKLYFAGFLIRARIDKDYNAAFVFAQTQTITYDRWVKLMSMRSGQPGINSQEYASFQFKIPHRKEQDKIAIFLSLIDEKIQTQNKIIEELKMQKASLLHNIFSQKCRFKDDNGKKFPDWEVKRLGEIATITTGNSNREDSILNGEFTFFDRSQDIRTSSRYLFDKEAVIIPGEGQEFIPKYFTGKFDLHQRTYAIFDFKNIDGKYLFYHILQNDKHLQSQAVGSTVKSLRLPMFETMPIFLPSIEEQIKISTSLSYLDEKMEVENLLFNQLQTQKQYLLSNLFI